MSIRYNMDHLCVWYDRRYTPLVKEISTWAKVDSSVTYNTEIILVLFSDERHLYDVTLKAFTRSKKSIPVVCNPTLNNDIIFRLYSTATQLSVPFFVLDYKPFDLSIRSLHTGMFVKHIDIKTYYSDGPPIQHETFHNMSSVLDIMGEKQFNYADCKANIVQSREVCNLTTMRCGAATCVLYSGISDCGNIDIIHVYGDNNQKNYIHELDMPQDCESYYERYGACIKMFLQNVNILDKTYHEQRIKMISSKFKFVGTSRRIR